jgi:lipopolysaccharide/colanic/teichoic acid biosynthesis glycosyltransferase
VFYVAEESVTVTVAPEIHWLNFSAVRLDIQYAEKWNLLLDLKIILKTFKVVLSEKGAY